MYRNVFSFLLGLMVILLSSTPLIINADEGEGHSGARQDDVIARGGPGIGGRQGAGISGRQGLGLAGRTDRDFSNRTIDRYQDNRYQDYTARYNDRYGSYGYGYPNYGTFGYAAPVYNSYDSAYDYNYPSYSSYSSYTNYSSYPNTYYGGYYYNPGMYNPNTTFVNPPSSMNYPNQYPGYSETYIYR